MLEFLKNIFSSEGFMPHGHCFLWKSDLLGLHVLSDGLIALSYFSIPALLVLLVRKSKDIPYPWMFLMFGAFILGCGATHIMGILIVWEPVYWLAGWVKAVTAATSIATAVLFVPLIPKALALRSPAELEAANRELQKQIAERIQAEEALRKTHDDLEMRVEERTRELSRANDLLKEEIKERKRAEESLRESEERYRILYENTPSMYFTVDREGRILSVNRFGAEQLGYMIEELIGQPVIDVFYEDDKKAVLEQLSACLGNPGQLYQWEFRKVRKDRSVLWVRESAHAVHDYKGNTVALIVCKDITDRKQAEDTIKESLAQLSKKNRYETIVSTVTRSVHRSINLQEVLENAVQAMYENIQGADFIAIYLVEGEEAVLRAHRNFPDWYFERAGRIPCPKGITWKTIMEGKPIYCGDVDNDSVIGPAGREVGLKSYLSMPIRFEGKTIGITGISSSRKNAFDENELKLLGIVTRQIEVAINNAQKAELLSRSQEEIRRLNEELEKRVLERTVALEATNKELEKEIVIRTQAEEALTESLAQLAKKNRYETIIGAVTRSVHQSIKLQSVLEHAVDAMNNNVDKAENVSIYLVEGEEAVLKAHRGLPDWYIERAGKISYPKGFTWKTILGGKPIYCSDIDQDALIGPAGRELGTKSYISTPIRIESKPVGVLIVHSTEQDAFDEDDFRLLEIVAQQIGVAINNARQTEVLRQSEERYRTLFDQSPVGVYLFDTRFRITQCNQRFIEIIGSSYDKVIGLDMLNVKDQSLTPSMIRAMGGQVTHHEGFYEATSSSARLWLSVCFSPLRDADGNVVAGMAVVEDITERKDVEEALRRTYDELEIKVQERTSELLKTNELLRNEIGERKRAEDRLRDTAERLQALSQRLSEIQETERRRLVEVLHDQIGQNLTALNINLNIMHSLISPESAADIDSRLRDSLQLVHETTVCVRDVMAELYPPVLNDYGLLSTLRWFGEETAARTGLEVTVEGEEIISRLPLEIETALFRIVQEAVNNIIKHACANHVKIRLEVGSAHLIRLSVIDDGVGFDPTFKNGAPQSWGLLIMHGRADAMGGRLRVNSLPGKGTEVIIEVGR